jgi:radical SAM superfamily enzyme YgiQ (UPF0313 family)
MYREKTFSVRPLEDILADVREAAQTLAPQVRKVFVLDGDALTMPLDVWEPLLAAVRDAFPKLRRVSCYATARNLLDKTPDELQRLRDLGLALLYIGPESGDDETLKRIAKGASADDHVRAAARARDAGFKQSLIFLLGAGGTERSQEHAAASARLATAMDPEYLSALTLMLVPGTPQYDLACKGRFTLPEVDDLLRELRTLVAETNPTRAIFRANHASNYLPIAGRLPRDRADILSQIDAALAGEHPLRPDTLRGL